MGIERQIIQRTITSSTTTTVDDDQIYANATSGAITVTLTVFGDGAEHQLFVQKTDSSANAVTVTDGTTSYLILAQSDSAIFIANAAGLYQAAATNVSTYRQYEASLSQSGTDAPVITAIQNSLGGTPVATYAATGSYNLTLASAFTADRTVVQVTMGGATGPGSPTAGQVYARPNGTSTILIRTTDTAGSLADDILKVASLTIRVYS